MKIRTIQTKITRHFKIIRRDLRLLWKSPIEYLYSFTYPHNKYVQIQAYDPKVTEIGKQLVNKIQKIYPYLKVIFIGSAVLGIAGQRDIDLIIVECDPKDFPLYIGGLVSVLGQPVKVKSSFVEWIFNYKRCVVEALLIGKANPISRKTIQTFKRIQKNKNFLREYEKLKLKSNGVSLREYKRRRLEFFNYVDGR